MSTIRWHARCHTVLSILLVCLLQGTAGGFAVQFGASKDSQTAADTQALAGE